MINRAQRSALLVFCVGIIVAISLSACDSSSLKVSATFAHSQDIREGAPVLFNNAVVGSVSDVQHQDGGARAELTLQRDAVIAIDGSAAVVLNRFKSGAPLEIYNRSIPDNIALQDGQVLTGLDSMVQLGAWLLGDAIVAGSGAMSQYVESFQNYLQSEEFQREKAQIRDQLQDATKAAQAAIKELEIEMADSTEELAATQHAAAQAVQALGDELAPIVQELAGNGAELLVQLEKFSARLAQAEPEQQRAGQEFLTSLLATIEKLNQSIERGLAEKIQPTPQNN